MIPGERFIKDGEIELNAGRKTVTLTVANTGDRPIQVGSHYHFFETNPALKFERKKARGMRLDIAAGTAVRFEPGQTRDVTLVALAGKRTVYGFRQDVMGKVWSRVAARRIMTGELAPARHVLSAATRCWEPGSNQPHGARPVAPRHPDQSGLGDLRIRQAEHERSVIRISRERSKATETREFTSPVDKTGDELRQRR